MGVSTPKKTERNEQLVLDYLKKDEFGVYEYSITQLEERFDLSKQRIMAILKSMGIQPERGGIEYYNRKEKLKKEQSK